MNTEWNNFFNSEDLNLATSSYLRKIKNLEDEEEEKVTESIRRNFNFRYRYDIDSKQIALLLPLIAMKSQIGQFKEIWNNLNSVKKDIDFKLVKNDLDLLESINDLSPKMLEYFDFKYDIFENSIFNKKDDIREYFNYQNEKELVEKYIMLMLILYYEYKIFEIIAINVTKVKDVNILLKNAKIDGYISDYSLAEYEVIAKQEIEDLTKKRVLLYEKIDNKFEKLLKEVQAVQFDNIL